MTQQQSKNRCFECLRSEQYKDQQLFPIQLKKYKHGIALSRNDKNVNRHRRHITMPSSDPILEDIFPIYQRNTLNSFNMVQKAPHNLPIRFSYQNPPTQSIPFSPEIPINKSIQQTNESNPRQDIKKFKYHLQKTHQKSQNCMSEDHIKYETPISFRYDEKINQNNETCFKRQRKKASSLYRGAQTIISKLIQTQHKSQQVEISEPVSLVKMKLKFGPQEGEYIKFENTNVPITFTYTDYYLSEDTIKH